MILILPSFETHNYDIYVSVEMAEHIKYIGNNNYFRFKIAENFRNSKKGAVVLANIVEPRTA